MHENGKFVTGVVMSMMSLVKERCMFQVLWWQQTLLQIQIETKKNLRSSKIFNRTRKEMYHRQWIHQVERFIPRKLRLKTKFIK